MPTTRGKKYNYSQPKNTNRAAIKAAIAQAAAPRPQRALTTAIKRVVNKNMETKYVSFYPYSNSQGTLNGTNFTPAITSAGECYALIPR